MGVAGTATEIIAHTEPSDPLDWAATLKTWFLYCPGQSPAWSHYGLSVVHLRPIEGVRPAIVHLDGATHEVLLVAYDPQYEPKADDMTTWRFMLPVNLAHQVRVPDDEAAIKLIDYCAEAVIAGRLWAEPPLTGQTYPWKAALDATAEHLRGEH